MQHKINIDNPESLGLKSVSGLVNQLDGNIKMKEEDGIKFEIIF